MSLSGARSASLVSISSVSVVVEEGVDCVVVHYIAVIGRVMVVFEEGWWWVVCCHDVSDGGGGGIHGGYIVRYTCGPTVGVATGWRCGKGDVGG